jgi:nickel superoxide dismutase
MRRALAIALTAAAVLATTTTIGAHCQIPCGIYDDMMRIRMLHEHVATIDKSVRLIGDLAGKHGAADINQVVRWVENKDAHADALAEIVVEYFLQQRVKAPQGDDQAARKLYVEQLEALHGLLVGSMKAKQTVDPEIASVLTEQIERFSAAYFSEEQLEVLADHRH